MVVFHNVVLYKRLRSSGWIGGENTVGKRHEVALFVVVSCGLVSSNQRVQGRGTKGTGRPAFVHGFHHHLSWCVVRFGWQIAFLLSNRVWLCCRSRVMLGRRRRDWCLGRVGGGGWSTFQSLYGSRVNTAAQVRCILEHLGSFLRDTRIGQRGQTRFVIFSFLRFLVLLQGTGGKTSTSTATSCHCLSNSVTAAGLGMHHGWRSRTMGGDRATSRTSSRTLFVIITVLATVSQSIESIRHFHTKLQYQIRKLLGILKRLLKLLEKLDRVTGKYQMKIIDRGVVSQASMVVVVMVSPKPARLWWIGRRGGIFRTASSMALTINGVGFLFGLFDQRSRVGFGTNCHDDDDVRGDSHKRLGCALSVGMEELHSWCLFSSNIPLLKSW